MTRAPEETDDTCPCCGVFACTQHGGGMVGVCGDCEDTGRTATFERCWCRAGQRLADETKAETSR
jgi:hypothetical protein